MSSVISSPEKSGDGGATFFGGIRQSGQMTSIPHAYSPGFLCTSHRGLATIAATSPNATVAFARTQGQEAIYRGATTAKPT